MYFSLSTGIRYPAAVLNRKEIQSYKVKVLFNVYRESPTAQQHMQLSVRNEVYSKHLTRQFNLCTCEYVQLHE